MYDKRQRCNADESPVPAGLRSTFVSLADSGWSQHDRLAGGSGSYLRYSMGMNFARQRISNSESRIPIVMMGIR